MLQKVHKPILKRNIVQINQFMSSEETRSLYIRNKCRVLFTY